MGVTITASIVLYKNAFDVLKLAINSFLDEDLDSKLFLVDNSPTDDLKTLVIDPKIEYIHNPSNPGFGAAHNIAIMKAIEMGAKYHFIVNPDIFFESDIINTMVAAMENDSSIGMMMPQSYYRAH